MKVCLIFPEGEYFINALTAARGALHGHDIVQLSPRLLDSHDTSERLAQADLVVADVSGRNGNVLYFLGQADALKKQVLLLTASIEDFPFAMDRQPIVYARDAAFLKEELVHRISSRPSAPSTAGAVDARQKFNELFGDLMQKHGEEHRGPIEMENEKTFVLKEQDLELALVQDLSRRARTGFED